AIVRTHRRLTSDCAGTDRAPRRDADRRTLVACSGGCDSTALALALRTTSIPLVLAHVVHDMRPAPEALADRDHAEALARALAIPFAEAHVTVRAPDSTNLEA